MLPIAEIYQSFQSTGMFSGRPAAFIHLYGGALIPGHALPSLSEALEARRNGVEDAWALAGMHQIVRTIEKLCGWSDGTRLVVIYSERAEPYSTPNQQQLRRLMDLLVQRGFVIMVETNATHNPPFQLPAKNVWHVVKPELVAKWEHLSETLVAFADEIVWEVENEEELDRLTEFAAWRQVNVELTPDYYSPRVEVVPVHDTAECRELVMSFCLDRGAVLSPQVRKHYGLC